MSDALKDNGGPAFPRPMVATDGSGTIDFGEEGMTLRDWFAGQAIIGFLNEWIDHSDLEPSTYAMNAYKIADAMLAARKE